MKWKRPKTFIVNNRLFRIQYVSESVYLDSDDVGLANYEMGEIIIKTHIDGRALPEDSVKETLFHELKHIEFYAAGLPELGENEAIVLQSSNIALQIWESLK